MQASAIPRILLVASEAVPFAKTGGLGDVITPLAATLPRRGVDVTLLLPAYRPALRAARALQELAVLDEVLSHAGVKRLIQRNGMAADFSWDRPAAAFFELYRELADPQDRALFGALAEPAWPIEAHGGQLMAGA